MASSAKFLEEALSTDVDESAVSAIVGSLETQLHTAGATSSASPQPAPLPQHSPPATSSPAAGPINTLNSVTAPHVVTQPTQSTDTNVATTVITATPTSTLTSTPPPVPTPAPPPVPAIAVPAATETTTLPSSTSDASSSQGTFQPNGSVTTVSAAPSIIGTSTQPPSTPPPSASTAPRTMASVVVANGAEGNTVQDAMPKTVTNPVQQLVNPGSSAAMTTTSQVTSAAQLASLAKVQPGEHVKIVYPGSGQVITAANVVAGPNGKLAFPAAHLANGTMTVGQPILQNAANTVSNTTGSTQPKPTALVIKSSGVAPTGMVNVPMNTVPVSATTTTQQSQQLQPQSQQQTQPGKQVQAATAQTVNATASTIVPSNVQILNVNAMRPATPVAGQQTNKQVNTARVVIGSHVMGGRAGTPGITLQTLQGLQAGAGGGHLLLKTENGQFQLLRVGPAPSSSQSGTVTANSMAGQAVVATPGAAGQTYRLATLPAVSRLNAQFTGPTLATIKRPIQTVAPTVTTTTVTTPATSATIANVTTTAPAPVATPAQTTSTPTQRPATENNTKEKCRKFLANLLELSSREPKHVERNVRVLIQELIDARVEPEEFCVRLEKLLNASPQPCLIGFLRKSLPLLRQSLVTKELIIDGIRPPPPNVVFCIASATPAATQQNQRPTVAVAPAAPTSTPAPTQVVSAATVVSSSMVPGQVRMMAPLPGVTNSPRPPQPIVQQRMVRPVTTVVRPPTAFQVKTTTVPAAVQQPQMTRPPAPAVLQKSLPSTAAAKTVIQGAQVSTSKASTVVTSAGPTAKSTVPSVQTKQTVIKEKEKKTFSSAGYTGDDDINDVAAMGGVNLAEESQKILGSTKFVGTQIRSCKDEIFLHMSPLQQRISKTASSYGLEEPSQEVASIISHAVQERLKNLVEKLAIIAEHRIDLNKGDPRYEVTQDVRSQLKFLEDLDRVERKRHEEQEREVLLKAAKSRSKTEDPEQAKLKAKAKEMQRVEMEEARQREANLTALQAIGPRKKPKLDTSSSGTSSSTTSVGISSLNSGLNRQLPLRPRVKRVNYRDLLFLLEQEKETCRSTTLYKSYLK